MSVIQLALVDSDATATAVIETSNSTQTLQIPFYSNGFVPDQSLLKFWNIEVQTVESSLPEPFSVARAMPENVIVALPPFHADARLIGAFLGRVVFSANCHSDIEVLMENQNIESVMVLCSHIDLTYDFLSRILRHQSMTDDRPSIGVLTGLSPNEVRWGIVKCLAQHTLPLDDDDLSLLGLQKPIDGSVFGGSTALWKDDLKPETLQYCTDKRWGVSFLLSHSNGVDGDFGPYLLCPVELKSFPVPLSEFGNENGFPSCAVSELCQRDPEQTRKRIHPASIPTEVAIYDTCAGILGASAFATARLSLGRAFLRGTAAAFITTTRKKSSSAFCSVMSRALIRDGMPLGNVVKWLNRFQSSEYNELPSWILFGDPAYQHVSNGGHERANRLGPIDQAAHHVPQSESEIVIALDDARGQQQAWAFSDVPRNGDSKPRHDLLPRPRTVPSESMEGNCFFRTLLDGLARNVPTIDCAPAVSLANEIDVFLSNTAVLDQHLQSGVMSLKKHEFLSQASYGIRSEFSRLNSRVAATWSNFRQWLVLHHYYGHACEIQSETELPQTSCPYCGEMVTVRDSSSGRFAWNRRMFVCIRCGVLGDTPVASALPIIEGPSECKSGKSAEYTLNAGITGEEHVAIVPYFGGFGAAVIDAKLPSILHSQPQGTSIQKFTVTFGPECATGLYSLVVVVADSMMLSTCARYIQVQQEGLAL